MNMRRRETFAASARKTDSMTLRATLTLTAVATALLGLSACRSDDKGRPLSFEPGVYKGDKAPPISEQQAKSLRDRGALQR
jgi:hypothetical protein